MTDVFVQKIKKNEKTWTDDQAALGNLRVLMAIKAYYLWNEFKTFLRTCFFRQGQAICFPFI